MRRKTMKLWMVILLLLAVGLSGAFAYAAEIGIGGEKLTAAKDVKWDTSPEHFGEGSWTSTTDNHWDWMVRVYRDNVEVYQQSIANWCRSWEPLKLAKQNGKMDEPGNYTFTVQPRDKSSASSDVKDIAGPESAHSNEISYTEAAFSATGFDWKNNTAVVKWTKPEYAGTMSLILYKAGKSGSATTVYRCAVDANQTSMDLNDYITEPGTYWCELKNEGDLFLNGGSTAKIRELKVDSSSLPTVSGLQWETDAAKIGCVTWAEPSGNISGYAVTLYKDNTKVITVDSETNSADLYPYFTGDGMYSFTVQTTSAAARGVRGTESEKCNYAFAINRDMTASTVTYVNDPDTNTTTTVQWSNPPAYVTDGLDDTYRVELYRGNTKVKTVTVKGHSVNLYNAMQAGGSGTYIVKVSGQVRGNTGVYGKAGTAETQYTYNEAAGTGDFIVTGGQAGTDYTWDEETQILRVLTATPLTISGTTEQGAIVIESGKTANVTLDGVKITNTTSERPPIQIGEFDQSGTTLNLTLNGENVCSSSVSDSQLGTVDPQNQLNAGIYVGKNTLNINGSGRLTAIGAVANMVEGAPGICVIDGGTVRITEGSITASAAEGALVGAAGIGTPGMTSQPGADYSDKAVNAGTVILAGGSVTAVGCSEGACIGVGGGQYFQPKTMNSYSAKNSWLIARGADGWYGFGSATPTTAVGGGMSSGNQNLEKNNSTNSVVITYLSSEKDADGKYVYKYESKVYGSPTLKNCEPENPEGNTLEIGSGQTVTIGENAILTNNGTITIKSGGTLKIANGGLLVNNGTINIENGGKVVVDETNKTITSSGSLAKDSYPKKVVTKTEFTSLQVKKNGNWTDITNSNCPEYGDTIRIGIAVKNTLNGEILPDLNDNGYKLSINGTDVPVSALQNGKVTAEITLTGEAWNNWKIGKNTITTKLSVSSYTGSDGKSWSISNTEAETEITVETAAIGLETENSLTAEGTYGDSLDALTFSGGKVVFKNSGMELPGIWMFQKIQNGKVSAAIYPAVNGTEEYTAVFVPKAPSIVNVIDDELTVEIKPTMEYLEAPENPYTMAGSYTDGKTVWVKSDADKVTISPVNGYTMAEQPFGKYHSYVETALGEINDTTGFYLKDSNGHITAKILLKNYVVKDGTAPTAEIKIGDSLNSYKVFTSSPEKNSLFLKLSQQHEITIEAKDRTGTGETKASGIKEIRYCAINQSDLPESLTEENIETLINKEVAENADKLLWLPYDSTNGFSLGRQGIYVVVAKVTDYLGNVSYVNTGGLVVYRDSALQEDSKTLSYTKTSREAQTAVIDLYGNKLDKITVTPADGNAKELVLDNDYKVSVDKDVATVTFSGDWLDTLEAGEYTLTFSYKPQGADYNNEGDAPAESSATLTVSRASLDTSYFTFSAPDDLTYTNTAKQAEVR